MGNLTLRCALSGLPINTGDAVVGCITAMKKALEMPNNGIHCHDQDFLPASFLFDGYYDDYGDVRIPNQTTEFLLHLSLTGFLVDDGSVLSVDAQMDDEPYSYGLIMVLKDVYEAVKENGYTIVDDSPPLIMEMLRRLEPCFFYSWFRDGNAEERKAILEEAFMVEDLIDANPEMANSVESPNKDCPTYLAVPITGAVHKEFVKLLTFYYNFVAHGLPFMPNFITTSSYTSNPSFHKKLAEITLRHLNEDATWGNREADR